jgi:precorrin-2/cobalt-factor-2 C20-methyltransferase
VTGVQTCALPICKIADPFIDEGTTEIAIDMPMRVEREPAQAAYDAGAARIADVLDRGEDVVMLCEGDPFFYGSFMYVHDRLKSAYAVEVVPGVTSVTACAAALGQPLCRRDDVLKILPATLPAERLEAELAQTDAAAILKVGRHFPEVKAVLGKLDLINNATAISNATHDDQIATSVAKISYQTLPYFTTIIVRK